MMKLLIATHNTAKYRRYRTILEQVQDLTLLSLRDVAISEKIAENGMTAEENARKKAQGYASLAGLPTLSIDEALFVEGFRPEEQPGVNVRRYLGREATDEELLATFLEKMKLLAPHQRRANWTYAICMAFPHGKISLTQVSIPTLFTDEPHSSLLPGYPLHSLQIDPRLGKKLCDCTPEEEHLRLSIVYEAVGDLVREAQTFLDTTGVAS
ncbi:MAG TPA: non-canonical purine NTP pyrophosphatase [Nitrososphaera sp.]|jgi:XTP/dITP diphosphohydrolase